MDKKGENEKRPKRSKFMVSPSKYEIFKFGGQSLKNEERGMQLMLQYFSEYFTEEQLRVNMQHYNLENMFALVKKYFQKEYNYTGGDIELNNLYQRSVNSYIYDDTENPAVVHIDELFESTVMAFFLAVFKWSKDFEDLEIYGNCFRYLLYLMNDVCILGEMQGEDANKAMLEMVAGDLQILQLAEDCYWTVLAFSLAHEIAHAYLSRIGKVYTEQHPEKEEYDADAIAYHIVLKIIMDKEENNGLLEEYTYLAPMMYMDFFDLMFYTDRVLYKTKIYDLSHPAMKKRKNHLFGIVDRSEYDFDTVDGNHLYSGFLDVHDEFKDQVLLKMERGKLNKILRTDQREKMRRRKNDEETGE
ncbi:MAG: hypothetical protein IJ147_01680 [Lachnospiraceae bacterium]|nr:hypothetical protein [Lachnospiraceae bacterium]